MSTRAPHCPVFGKCGGCSWQDIEYSEQIKRKSLAIKEAVEKYYDRTIEVHPSPNEYRYRNRIQLHKKGRQVGYFAKRTHDLVAIDDCPIAEENITPLIVELRDSQRPDGKYELLYGANGGEIRSLQNDEPEFTQVNAAQNTKLKNLIFERIEGRHFTQIYDLYCGSGNITFPLAYIFKNTPISGVEANLAAITKALQKAHLEKLNLLTFFAQDVAEFLERAHSTADTLIIADPPRAGLENQVVDSILELEPKEIIYVSCHLATLTRDLQKLTSEYAVDEVIGIDMFPQTPYIETLSFLSRK